MVKTVFIIEPSFDYIDMFRIEGWNVVFELPKNINSAKNFLFQFTGGSDVSPSFYEEHPHPTTFSNLARDEKEREIFNLAASVKAPIAGICRGGQFLNVMNGGGLYQNVDGHAISGTHLVLDEWTREMYPVTSTHHQMIRITVGNPPPILIASANISTCKEYFPLRLKTVQKNMKDPVDIECLYYPRFKSLCFQPHPEFPNALECRVKYFKYIAEYLFNERTS